MRSSGLEWEVVLVGGAKEYVVAGTEEEVWEEYGDEAVSVECVGMRVNGVSI